MGDGNYEPYFKMPEIKLNPKVIITILVIIIVGSIGVSTFYKVDQTSQAVILRLGKFNRITGAGLHVKIPFGIEKSFIVPTQVIQTMSFGFRPDDARDYIQESVMLTGDLNIVDVEWIIQYTIPEPQKWLFDVEDKAKTIRDISQSIINMLVGDRKIFDVIGKERIAIETEGKNLINLKLKSYNLGINVTTVKLRNIVPPIGAVQDSFEDVNKAQQDMSRLINEGKEAYNKEIPKAKGEAERIIQEAMGYAAERVNKAEGDVARFNLVYDEYKVSRDVTRTRLYIEMIEDVFKGQDNTDLIDKSLRNFVPFKALSGNTATAGGTQ